MRYVNVLTPEQMRNHLYTFERMRDSGAEDPSPWDAYGFEAASRTGSPVELPILDIDLAVPLVSCSSYREIWLDYRPTDGPRVVLGYDPDDDDSDYFGRTWTVIADSFDEFLARYFPEVPSSTPE